VSRPHYPLCAMTADIVVAAFNASAVITGFAGIASTGYARSTVGFAVNVRKNNRRRLTHNGLVRV